MKVYYNTATNTVFIGDLSQFFPKGALIASNIGDNILIKYTNQNLNLVFADYTKFEKQDGTSAGITPVQVVTYLNTEFNKYSITPSLPIYNTDPITASVGDVYVLETIENPSGTIQGFVGGIPVLTQQDDYKHELSVVITGGTIKRTLLQ